MLRAFTLLVCAYVLHTIVSDNRAVCGADAACTVQLDAP